MCGIAGFFRKDTTTFTLENLTKALLELQTRGRDATGWAWPNSHGNVLVCKAAGSAASMLGLPKATFYLQSATKGRWAFLHCRQGTHGTPLNNANNHPIFTNECVLIHNGVIHTSEQVETLGECDSEVIGRLIDKHGLEEAILHFTGSVALAVYLFKEPNAIYLYREDNPIRYIENEHFFAFASTQETLTKMVPCSYTDTKDIPTYSLCRVSASGLEVIKKYPHTTFQGYPPYSHYQQAFGESETEVPFVHGAFLRLLVQGKGHKDSLIMKDGKKRRVLEGVFRSYDDTFVGEDRFDYLLDIKHCTFWKSPHDDEAARLAQGMEAAAFD